MKLAAAFLALALVTRASGAGPAPAPADVAEGPWVILPGDDGSGTMPLLIDDVPLHPAPGGLALTVVDGLWHLVPATLSGRFVVADGKSAVALEAAPADARIYVRITGLVPGKVDTPDMRFRGAARLLASLPVTIAFKGASWRFDHDGDDLTLATGSRRQRLGPGTDGEAMRSNHLVWAGDLDRDGKLDIILRTTIDSESTWCVWLSSRAGAGQLVGSAACMTRHW